MGTCRVSLIITLYNERESVDCFFRSLAAFTRLPDELVLVDGGSTDGTVAVIQAHLAECPVPVKLIEEPGCTIARGRNVAIQNAQYDVIAVTDMGCTIPPEWLERIVAPLEADGTVEVVGGYYEPICHTPIQTCYANLTHKPRLDPRTFWPSSRSLALRRHVWEAVGGYPEHLNTGEDALFDIRIREKGFKEVFAPDAQVLWEIKDRYWGFLYQFYRYGRGAGHARIQGGFYAFYIATYALFVLWTLLALAVSPLLWLVLAAHGAAYVHLRVFRKERVRARLSLANAARYLLLTLCMDLGFVLGYLVGTWLYLARVEEGWRPARDKR